MTRIAHCSTRCSPEKSDDTVFQIQTAFLRLAPCGNPALDGRDCEPVTGTVVDREVREFLFDEACEHIKVNRLDSERGDGCRTRLAAGNYPPDRLTKRLAIASTDGIWRAKGAERCAVLFDGAPVSGLKKLRCERDASLFVNAKHGVRITYSAIFWQGSGRAMPYSARNGRA